MMDIEQIVGGSPKRWWADSVPNIAIVPTRRRSAGISSLPSGVRQYPGQRLASHSMGSNSYYDLCFHLNFLLIITETNAWEERNARWAGGFTISHPLIGWCIRGVTFSLQKSRIKLLDPSFRFMVECWATLSEAREYPRNNKRFAFVAFLIHNCNHFTRDLSY